jgi:hypothetical protein
MLILAMTQKKNKRVRFTDIETGQIHYHPQYELPSDFNCFLYNVKTKLRNILFW